MDRLEKAVTAAKQAIADADHRALGRLVKREPDLLAWRAEHGEVLLQATTSYANWHGPDDELTWNRPRCAAVLLKAGALFDESVSSRALETGATEMLALFDAHGVLPQDARYFAALGDAERLRKCLAGGGEAKGLAEVFLTACRYARRELAAEVLGQCCDVDEDLAGRLPPARRADFVEEMLERAPTAAPFSLPTTAPRGPSPLWRFAVEMRLHETLSVSSELAGQDRSEVSTRALADLLRSEAWLLDEAQIPVQQRYLEVAAYSSGVAAQIEAFLEAQPAILRCEPAPDCPAISYALEYGNARYLPALTRIWTVPDDLPHAAARGDLAAMARLLDSEERRPLPDLKSQSTLDRALAWAVQNAAYDAAEYLLARGADINTRWGTHEPAGILHEVAAAGRFEQVRWLVAHGVDVTRTDARFGATAAGWAEYGGHEEIQRFLEECARGAGS